MIQYILINLVQKVCSTKHLEIHADTNLNFLGYLEVKSYKSKILYLIKVNLIKPLGYTVRFKQFYHVFP